MPLYFSSDGLGSKVSTCDGPPFMNRKMTRLAFAANIGALGASWIVGGPGGGGEEAFAGEHRRQTQGAETAADLAQRLPAVH